MKLIRTIAGKLKRNRFEYMFTVHYWGKEHFLSNGRWKSKV